MAERVLHCDFETHSACDLKAAGLDNYAKHPTTDAWCMAYAVDEHPVKLVTRDEFVAFGEALRKLLPLHTVYAHNAAFELAIWNNVMVRKYGWPALKLEQTKCTMSFAYAMALPGALEKAAPAAGITQTKDAQGHRVMMQLAKPKEIIPAGKQECPECDGEGHHLMMYEFPVPCKTCKGARTVTSAEKIVWHDDPTKLEKLYAYCKQDVEVERALCHRLLALPPKEHALWLLDYRCNSRGVYVDRAAVGAAIQVVESEQTRLHSEMRAVTSNAVATCSAVGQLGDWIKAQGVAMPGVAKADVLDALDGDLPVVVRRALKLRQEAAKSSTAKLKKMIESASADGRLRNMFQYHGASTGRWAGRKVQLQNIPRPKLKQHQIEAVFSILEGDSTPQEKAALIDALYGSPLEVISWCLRGFLRAAPGKHLIAADFANIEGRMLAWLAGEDWKLQAFRDFDAGIGPDLYLVAAAAAYRVPVESLNKQSPERQPGKVCELAFGFQGGVGAWRKMEAAAPDMPDFSDDQVNEFKDKWRAKHPAIVQYWYDLERAAIDAVLHPGQVFSVGPKGRQVHYKVKGSFLWAKLPSGRNICYPYPRLKEKETPWGEMKECIHYMTVDSTTGKWVETSTYGGDQSNHVTQGDARDLLAQAMTTLEDGYGYEIAMHVHDEAVVEVDEKAPAGEQSKVEWVMKQVPLWATGLPIAVEGWRGVRYRK